MPQCRVRPMRTGDLDEMTAIARLTLPYDPITGPLMEEKTFGDPCLDQECSLLAVRGREIVSFMPVAIAGVTGSDDPRTAFIKVFATRPDCRQEGITSRLLAQVEKRLRRKGVASIRVINYPTNYLAPGLDVRYTAAHCFLEKNGFRKIGEGINLICGLLEVNFDLEDRIKSLRQHRIDVRRAQKSDLRPTLTLLNRFWAAWEREVSESWNNRPISTFLALSGKKVVGFSSYEGNNKGSGSFGPMGTDPEYRKKGIGEVLCLLCLHGLRELGHRQAVIPWVGPIRFYSRVCGARIDRVFWQYEKVL